MGVERGLANASFEAGAGDEFRMMAGTVRPLAEKNLKVVESTSYILLSLAVL